MSRNIKRILVYTHNSIGLGHAFRSLALITGIRKWRPDIDFLVISGTSIPQIFFREGIELIKLPSIKLDIDRQGSPMHSRYLSGFEVEEIFDFRQRIILESFSFFQPDVLLVEHNMTGQMSELIPVLMKKWMRKGGPVDFCLVHACRGIMRWVPLLEIPYQNPRHRSESINIGSLYDFMYVLEDRGVIDINKEFLGNDPELEKKIRYLGKITNKVYSDLASREETLRRFGLEDRKTILLSLGRNNRVPDLAVSLLQSFERCGLLETHQVVMTLDQYLNGDARQALTAHPLAQRARLLSFFPDLVDLVHHSDLVISRAGYNMVNEILLTGSRAVLIPESHGGGEQEMRAASIHEQGIEVVSEQEVLDGLVDQAIRRTLNCSECPSPRRFDKHEIGKAIISDLEQWKSARG